MNCIEIVLSRRSMAYFLQHGEVVFNYLGVLYKVKKQKTTGGYVLYRVRESTKSDKQWLFVMYVEEPVCLDEGVSSQVS